MSDALIRRMDAWLAANRPEYYATLLPGATDEQLDAFERRFEMTLPRGFRALYGWRNGQDPMSFDSLQGNWMFASLEDVTDTKDTLDGMIGYDFEDPAWWRAGWVPFLGNGGGSHLCVDMRAEDGGQPGQLIEFWKADADRPIAYPDFAAWLRQLVDAMEGGTLELS